jgi:hypothetical protein
MAAMCPYVTEARRENVARMFCFVLLAGILVGEPRVH